MPCIIDQKLCSRRIRTRIQRRARVSVDVRARALVCVCACLCVHMRVLMCVTYVPIGHCAPDFTFRNHKMPRIIFLFTCPILVPIQRCPLHFRPDCCALNVIYMAACDNSTQIGRQKRNEIVLRERERRGERDERDID